MAKQICVKIIGMVALLFMLPYIAYALDVKTHQEINEVIANGSFNEFSLNSYLINNLNMQEGIRTLGMNKGILEWLETGGKEEDRIPRMMNHFHHPITNKGFVVSLSKSAVEWATMDIGTQEPSQDNYSWHDVRDYFYKALTSLERRDRDYYFTRTFQGIGQLLHLIQDMSVPDHTRDDGHVVEAFLARVLPGYGYEAWVKNPRNVNISTYNPIFFDQTALRASNPLVPDLPVINLFDTNTYNGNNPGATYDVDPGDNISAIGLSEYTNANFLSPDTMFLEHPYYPYPRQDSVESWADPANNRRYLKKETDGEPVQHLAVISFLWPSRRAYFPMDRKYLPVKLDYYCYKEYSDKLLPRAIGYSAALLDYFFRGRLEITPPDRYLYGIADPGTKAFSEIQLKLWNTTPDEEMSTGELTAVMKYRLPLNPDFDPVATAPLDTDYVDYDDPDNYAYSVSEPIQVGIISADDPQEFTFTFNDPVPTNALDLSLMIVYRGELGLEEDAVVAQYKDLCEPHHLFFWNNTDYCCVKGTLYTPSEITASPELSRQLDTDGNGKPDIYYFASPVNIYITFAGSTPTPEPTETTYTVAFHDLPPGNYGEVVVLQDQDTYYCSTLWNVIDSSPEDFPGFDFYWYIPDKEFPGHRTYFAYQTEQETDQMGTEFFNYQPHWHRLVPTIFRGIPIQHGIRFAFTHPDEIACEDSDWPDAPNAQAYPPVNR